MNIIRFLFPVLGPEQISLSEPESFVQFLCFLSPCQPGFLLSQFLSTVNLIDSLFLGHIFSVSSQKKVKKVIFDRQSRSSSVHMKKQKNVVVDLDTRASDERCGRFGAAHYTTYRYIRIYSWGITCSWRFCLDQG
jgi:hypothetical protein